VSQTATTIRLIGLGIAFLVAVASWVLTCAAWRFDKVAAGVVPLDPRGFERMTLLTLGTAGAYEDPNRRGPVLALGLAEDVVLIDAGRGTAEALRAAKIPVSQPGVVLLTSLMPENAAGLDDLLAAAELAGRSEPLRVVGPPGTRALAESLNAAVEPGMRARRAALGVAGDPPRLAGEEVGAGFALERGAMKLTVGELPGGPLPALAWRAEWRGRVALVSSAGWDADALVAFGRGAHLLVHEAAMVPTPEQAAELGLDEDPDRLRREGALHASFASVGEIAQRVGAETLVLVRLRPPPVYHFQVTSAVDDTFAGRIAVAEDGDELTP
jgi:ribonuclease BN (tRNA processing enzyme)